MERRQLLSAGDVDPGFGVGGISTLQSPGIYAMMAAVDVGYTRTIVASNWSGTETSAMVLTKLTAAGTPDATFGIGGGVSMPNTSAAAVRLQSDGRLLVLADAGDSWEPSPRLMRLTNAGAADASFSGDGVVGLTPSTRYTAVQTGAGGKIVVLGVATTAGGDRYIVERFLSDGRRDVTFGDRGSVITSLRPAVDGDDASAALAVQADGKVLVAGVAEAASSASPFVLRLTSSGVADGSFSGDGIAYVASGVGNAANGLAILPGGSIVVATSDGSALRPIRLSAAGAFEKAYQPITTDAPATCTLEAAADGKVVLFGSAFQNQMQPHQGLIARYRVDGSLDRTFVPGLGYAPIEFAVAGGLDGNGRIVIAGTAADGRAVEVRRYQSAGGIDSSGISLSASGTLTVAGTPAGEAIQVSTMPYDDSAFSTGTPLLQVQSGHTFRGFAPGSVKRIVVNAGGGDDMIDLSGAQSLGATPTVYAGDGNDYVLTYGVAGSLYGGKGDDQLTGSGLLDGGAGNDDIRGGDGDDILRGGAGNDLLMGFWGDDLLDGGAGSDDIYGENGTAWPGQGIDTVDYGSRTRGVWVSLDNVANDGEAGEADNVHDDIENIIGGAGNDVLRGSAAANTLYGNGGNDILWGRAGNDLLIGGPGRDRLNGESGNDRLLSFDDEEDEVDGGVGYDTAISDLLDHVASAEKKG